VSQRELDPIAKVLQIADRRGRKAVRHSQADRQN
jgi:hypothetical protein